MDQTALIWTLTLMLALMCTVLTVDFILRWRADRCRRDPVGAVDGVSARADRVVRPYVDGEQVDGVPARAAGALSPYGDGATVDCDLLGREKPCFSVKLPPDGKVLHLLTPTKAVSDRFQEIGKLLQQQEEGRLASDGVEALYKFTSFLVSNNRENFLLNVADLKARCSAEDIGGLLQAYLGWLTELVLSKN
ncbi:MAG: hypothetical protein E7434_01600 [Ruminococcaceae bacterium]|nr:hypothetical protein [Oscillospiraceae bacterium]